MGRGPMRLLAEIDRRKGVNRVGRTLYRSAVRGIIIKDGRLMMVYSTHNGDYKFPGGGVQRDESRQAALQREVREECGARVRRFGPAFGKVVEYDLPAEPTYEVFRMTSYYYQCQIDHHLGPLTLDPYEAALGFNPVWVDIDHAIRTNAGVLDGGSLDVPKWTARELFVLGQVKARLFS